MKNIKSEILIAGAGFAGSLTALCLNKVGFDVSLVERHRHPRFTIGESSTPIADMILRDLSDQYDLSWLKPLSRYGTWQDHYPEVVCGIKRGFSYYKHKKGISFTTDEIHSNELLVAASSSNENSDTNWLRSDFDSFLVDKVKESGIAYFDKTEINGGAFEGNWEFQATSNDKDFALTADFFIDATGSPALLNQLLGIEYSSQHFLTNSRAVYTHFQEVPLWSEKLQESGIPNADYPYDPDLSALHHLIEEGWLWMLRFNNKRTSMGLVLDNNRYPKDEEVSSEEEWRSVISAYPSIRELMDEAQLAEQPGALIRTDRLQRRLNRASGERWVALPYTVGFVDPLHSTGIAHTLSGVEKVLNMLTDHRNDHQQLLAELKKYEEGIYTEIEFIDYLVAGCYQTLDNFELFTIWSMLYFTATISYEQQRLQGSTPTHFLRAGNRKIQSIVKESYDDLQKLLNAKPISDRQVSNFRKTVKQRIKLHNSAGLLKPNTNNMYHHTVAEL